jgi:hypothetical protein
VQGEAAFERCSFFRNKAYTNGGAGAQREIETRVTDSYYSMLKDRHRYRMQFTYMEARPSASLSATAHFRLVNRAR